MKRRVVVLGHRGAPKVVQENTLESFRRALELGADGFEFDVRRSGDGRLAVVHNPRVGARFVSRCSYERLRSTRRGANMPLLEEVLREFGSSWLDIELKVPGIEAEVLELSATHCRAGSYVITSFSREVLARLRTLDPAAPLGWLLRRPVRPHLWQNIGLNYLVPHFTVLRPGFAEAARRAGLRLITWTVNSPRVLRRILDLGVDAVVSDFPDLVLAAVRGRFTTDEHGSTR